MKDIIILALAILIISAVFGFSLYCLFMMWIRQFDDVVEEKEELENE